MDGPPGSGFPAEDDKMRLGAQQAAMIQMQQEMEESVEQSRAAMEAQQEVLAMQQQALIEQENQKLREQQQLQMLQAAEMPQPMVAMRPVEEPMLQPAMPTLPAPPMAQPPHLPGPPVSLPPPPHPSMPPAPMVSIPPQLQASTAQPPSMPAVPPGIDPLRPPMELRPPLGPPGLGMNNEEPSGMGEGPLVPASREIPGQESPDSGDESDMKLPQALEKVLAFKGVRALQVGVAPEEIEKVEMGEVIEDDLSGSQSKGSRFGEDFAQYGQNEDDEADNDSKESKNKRKKKKKKRARRAKLMQPTSYPKDDKPEEDVEIEYVPEDIAADPTDPAFREFARIFETFKIEESGSSKDGEGDKSANQSASSKMQGEIPIKAKGIMNLEEAEEEEEEARRAEDDDKPKLSKKKMKKLNRLSVAELKQLVIRPDVVEMHDVTAQDPKLLVLLKSCRNTVPVPRHWCFKRKYLQGKRGIEKPPFELPGFIKATGIMEMRQALQDKEDQKTLKSRMREKVRPKMGKIDIDYQKLHDAFFKWQSKPKMSMHGDLYYEGKEFETRLKEKKPGNLSDDLRTALGMPIGQNCERYPPPWLIAMQRYGPPPSYPNLKIPGLNAPIPEKCSFGYHAGGWGKPPVDENGKPLYGDVFGTQSGDLKIPAVEEEVDKSYWGELESESEEEIESELEEEEEVEQEADASGLVTPGETGLVTPSGVTSVPVGVETPDMIELRKRRIEDAMDQGGDTPALYQVLPEKKSAPLGSAMMGSAHVYDVSGVAAAGASKKAGLSQDTVEVVLNPEELDMDSAAMQAKYEQTMREQQSLEKEDLSDMVAEHAAKQKKRKSKQQDSGKSAKKYKEFKF